MGCLLTVTMDHGEVVSVSDGICRVSGLADVMAGEMLEFPGDLRGMVMDLDSADVGVVLLGNFESVQEGMSVRRTGRIIEVPVGDAMIGRVVDSLGRPVDGRGPIAATEHRAIESPAPNVLNRQPVSVPLQTGIKAIDALIPIGRGQRELIIGDRQTGKTAIAIDTILNQKGKDVICIYVAIGQKRSTVTRLVEQLTAANESATQRWLHSSTCCPCEPNTVIIGITAVNTTPAAKTTHSVQATAHQSFDVRSLARKAISSTAEPAKHPPATMWSTSHQLDIPPHIHPITPLASR